jgi:hypothetical protein
MYVCTYMYVCIHVCMYVCMYEYVRPMLLRSEAINRNIQFSCAEMGGTSRLHFKVLHLMQRIT